MVIVTELEEGFANLQASKDHNVPGVPPGRVC